MSRTVISILIYKYPGKGLGAVVARPGVFEPEVLEAFMQLIRQVEPDVTDKQVGVALATGKFLFKDGDGEDGVYIIHKELG